MKSTVICNLNHGPFLSCRHQQKKREALEVMQKTLGQDWFESKWEQIQFDRGTNVRLEDISFTELADTWMSAPTVQQRGTFVDTSAMPF